MNRIIYCAAAFLFTATALEAQTTPPGSPKLQATVLVAITSIERGECPAKLMAPLLQYQCQQSLAATQNGLRQAGSIQGATFMGIQQMADGSPAEAYKVQFERREMFWMAAVDQGGRLTTLWSPG